MYIREFQIGCIGVKVRNGFVVEICWLAGGGEVGSGDDFYSESEIVRFDRFDRRRVDFELVEVVFGQLSEYFAGDRKIFDFPILPEGTEFQKQVWRQLQLIPYGETVSYGNIATKISNPKSARAVGNANNKNPIAIVVPCHRVIGANGNLVGYAAGLEIKEKLLALEKKYK
ncbi:MAG: methylated-DNA--[protein]-cysteine S-methyltransferase [Planctomycetaceae bacterium]|jgi:methylated-DNA-[protein]-cysteine S-methyltransferase|nr:methylated-DNA--[protein]-cysteine S-methyltransferase [Planctomycetaceae bacterium]